MGKSKKTNNTGEEIDILKMGRGKKSNGWEG